MFFFKGGSLLTWFQPNYLGKWGIKGGIKGNKQFKLKRTLKMMFWRIPSFLGSYSVLLREKTVTSWQASTKTAGCIPEPILSSHEETARSRKSGTCHGYTRLMLSCAFSLFATHNCFHVSDTGISQQTGKLWNSVLDYYYFYLQEMKDRNMVYFLIEYLIMSNISLYLKSKSDRI